MKIKTKILVSLVSIIALVGATGWFFSHYQMKFQNPIHIQSPIVISKRTVAIYTTVTQASADQNPLTDDQKFACNLFGKDCVTALAIMRAESHDRHDAIHVNKNGSVDIGCFQVNSIHLAQIDTSHLNLLNCQDNAKAAYAIYKQQKGFGAWSTFTSGEYKQYLIN